MAKLSKYKKKNHYGQM